METKGATVGVLPEAWDEDVRRIAMETWSKDGKLRSFPAGAGSFPTGRGESIGEPCRFASG